MNDITVQKNDSGLRPTAIAINHCHYCQQKIGEKHKSDCVCLKKTVKVRYTYEIEVQVPYDWDKNQIEFHRNGSSSCADNSIKEIQSYLERLQEINEGDCLCNEDRFKSECIDDNMQAEPYCVDENGKITKYLS